MMSPTRDVGTEQDKQKILYRMDIFLNGCVNVPLFILISWSKNKQLIHFQPFGKLTMFWSTIQCSPRSDADPPVHPWLNVCPYCLLLRRYVTLEWVSDPLSFINRREENRRLAELSWWLESLCWNSVAKIITWLQFSMLIYLV